MAITITDKMRIDFLHKTKSELLYIPSDCPSRPWTIMNLKSKYSENNWYCKTPRCAIDCRIINYIFDGRKIR